MQNNLNQRDSQSRKHGLWESYWNSGQIWVRTEYVHGKRHGPCIGYYRDGTLMYKENYDMGKLIGYYIEYNRYIPITKEKRFYAR